MPEQGDAGALARRRGISRAHYATLGELFDPSTFRHLDALGLRAGWRCWEVGAGLVTTAEIDQHLADIAAGRLDLATFTVVSAWGRKPP